MSEGKLKKRMWSILAKEMATRESADGYYYGLRNGILKTKEILDEANNDFPELKERNISGLGYQKIMELLENKLLKVVVWRKTWFGETKNDLDP